MTSLFTGKFSAYRPFCFRNIAIPLLFLTQLLLLTGGLSLPKTPVTAYQALSRSESHAPEENAGTLLATDLLPSCPAHYDNGSNLLHRLTQAPSSRHTCWQKNILPYDVVLLLLSLIFTTLIASISRFLLSAALAFQRERCLVVYLYHQCEYKPDFSS